jgi:hypothetical protein
MFRALAHFSLFNGWEALGKKRDFFKREKELAKRWEKSVGSGVFCKNGA